MQNFPNNQQENIEDIDTTDYTAVRRKPSASLKNLFDVIEAFIYAIVAVLFIFTFIAIECITAFFSKKKKKAVVPVAEESNDECPDKEDNIA